MANFNRFSDAVGYLLNDNKYIPLIIECGAKTMSKELLRSDTNIDTIVYTMCLS